MCRKTDNENRMKATLLATKTVKTEPDCANLIPWGPPEEEFEEDLRALENGKTQITKKWVQISSFRNSE